MTRGVDLKATGNLDGSGPISGLSRGLTWTSSELEEAYIGLNEIVAFVGNCARSRDVCPGSPETHGFSVLYGYYGRSLEYLDEPAIVTRFPVFDSSPMTPALA